MPTLARCGDGRGWQADRKARSGAQRATAILLGALQIYMLVRFTDSAFVCYPTQSSIFSAILCVSSLFMRLKHLLFHVALGHGFLAIGLVLEHIEGLFLAVHRNRVVPNHIYGML
jgi:hypothetical protein